VKRLIPTEFISHAADLAEEQLLQLLQECAMLRKEATSAGPSDSRHIAMALSDYDQRWDE
jgi:hypothetical protein